MSRISNLETEPVDLHFKRVAFTDPKKPGLYVDCQLELDLPKDDALGATLPARIAPFQSAIQEALQGGQALRVQRDPDITGLLELSCLVNDAVEVQYTGDARFRWVKVHATERYLRVVYGVRVYVANREKAQPFLNCVLDSVRAQFTAAQGVLPIAPSPAPAPKGRGPKAQDGQGTDDIPAVM
jgi:hypothetical protein